MQFVEALIINNDFLSGNKLESPLNSLILSCQERTIPLGQISFIRNDFAAIRDFYVQAEMRKNVVMSFGGINEKNSPLKAAIAEVFHAPIEFNPQADKFLAYKYGRDYTPQLRESSRLPSGVRLIPNSISAVPGFSFKNIHCIHSNTQVAAPMIDWVLDKYCRGMRLEKNYQALLVKTSEFNLQRIIQRLKKTFPRMEIYSYPITDDIFELGIEGHHIQVSATIATAKVMFASVGAKFQTSGAYIF